MTLNELRYVVAIAQEKSFGRAAQRCFVSQPALSVAIQKLEEELGTQLFERGKTEVTVTPVGERIVEQAQKVLEEATRIRDIAQAGRNQLVGLFRLGVIYTVAPYLLPDLIPALNERAPQMPLEIEENLTEHLEAALKTGRIDAAIIALPFQPSGTVTEFLYEEPFQVVVPQRHKWAKRKTVQPSELSTEHTILLNVGHCFRDQVLDACPELNRSDAPITRTNSLETVRNMVASGLGVSVLPRDALTPKYHSRLVVAVPFARPVPTRRIALAHRKSFPRPAAIVAIREAVEACRGTSASAASGVSRENDAGSRPRDRAGRPPAPAPPLRRG
jgi:LysR family transcriptional regulator, hydrogen peroxide-inducible genes activator